MMMSCKILLAVCSVLVSWYCRAGDTVVLSRGGVPQMEIVLSDAAAAFEVNAAGELKHYLDRITGGGFAIRRESGEPRSLPGIYVGNTSKSKEVLPEGTDGLPDDTIALLRNGRDLCLAGGGTRGTLYAVYAFLEDRCGVRWFTPEFETVPSRSELQLNWEDLVETPVFEYREPCHIGLNSLDTSYYDVDQIRKFALRMRSNGFLAPIAPEWGGRDICLPGAWLEFRRIIDPDVYFPRHPEWFAEVDGERVPGQLCLSNREMIATLTANFIHMIDQTPGVKHATITQNDTGREDYCHCAECRKILEEEEAQSGLLLRCVNAVAEEVEKKYPDLYVNTLAYHYTLAFPKKTRPRRNVSIQICCPDEDLPFDAMDSVNALDRSGRPEDRNFLETLRQWSALSPRLYAWTYQISFGDILLPIPNTFNLGPNFRTLADHRVTGVFAQGNAYAPIGDFVELKAWLSAKLLWNPYVDDRALIDEFLDAYYGKAAPEMRQYLQLIGEDYSRDRYQPHNAYADPPSLKPWMTLSAMNRATRIFAAAEEAVSDDPLMLEHLKRVGMCVDFQWLCGYRDYKREALQQGIDFLGPESLKEGLDRFIEDCAARKVWRLCEGNGSLAVLYDALPWQE